ncbi:hypothetical protein BCR35DRAFT_323900 [Leucosporidium creatinivorum]|uniref:Phytanoyl-CoA dioxygenase family protein n=1 Tax=Leucosporidium creatinivorum TaxID=106004 RepID=A0A1Y2FYW5_9BASI|nr:hypothetical protein BCR35DRAFT_323900 [Leucosporidium creatinivorum]
MSLVTVPVDTDIKDIMNIIRRDGGIIVKDFVTPAQVAEFNAESAPVFERLKANPDPSDLGELAKDFYASNTTHIRSMLGQLPKTTSTIIQHPLWSQVMDGCLSESHQSWVGDELVTVRSGYMLNNAGAYHVAPGAGAQVLHRDDAMHCPAHREGSTFTTITGCLVAGSKATEKNGATRVLPGSHLFGLHQRPLPEHTVPAEMEAGSALFWLGSTYHGAGANTCTPGEENDVRLLYGVFGCKDWVRQDEAILLSTPLDVVKSLPVKVLAKAGYAKSASGAGHINTHHPYARLDEVSR